MYNKIEIYTGPICIYCDRAKDLLVNKGLEFIEIKLSKHPERREEMLSRTGGKKTVPQIFINNQFIGGFRELRNLNSSGELNKILKL